MTHGPENQIATVLRGYDGWESVYSGQSLTYPLPLAPSSKTGRDPVAAKVYEQLVAQWTARGGGTGADLQDLTANADGIDPWLVLGSPCNPFQPLIFWFPIGFFNLTGGETTPFQYSIIWRLRSSMQYRLTRNPYSFPKAALGSINRTPTNAGLGIDGVTFAEPADDRLIIPSCVETIVYPEQNSGGSFTPAQGARVYAYNWQNVSPQPYDSQFTFGLLPNIRGPAAPPVAGIMGQGFSPFSVGLEGISHFAYTTMAKGDEFIVMLNADATAVEAAPTNWAFTPIPTINQSGVSRIFGTNYGFEDGLLQARPSKGQQFLGAYVIRGGV